MPNLFAERAFRTVYNSDKVFEHTRVYDVTDATIVYLQYVGVCRMTSQSPHVLRYSETMKRAVWHRFARRYNIRVIDFTVLVSVFSFIWTM